jgi:hypothetical protein
MFSLLTSLPIRRLLLEQLPSMSLAWLIAEFFYKFHSFSLECAAFLLTWLVFDAVIHVMTGRHVLDQRGDRPGS